MKRSAGWLLVAVCLVGCNDAKQTSSKPRASGIAAPSPVAALLVAGTWVGKLDNNSVQLVFTSARTLTAEMRYCIFGAVRSRDKLDVSIDGAGLVHLTAAAGANNVVVGAKGSAVTELIGTLAADKTTLSGTTPRGAGAPPLVWSASTTTKLADIDAPLDVAVGEQALIAGKWEGKRGPRPAKMVVARKAGRLVAVVTVDRAQSTYQIAVDATGHFTMNAAPRPTAQGLVTETGRGYFMNRDMRRLRGSIETSVKQGFIEQAGEEGWSFDDVRTAAKPH